MKPEAVHAYLLPSVAILFPHRKDLMTTNAQAMMLAIGLQESEFRHRQQLLAGLRDWWTSGRGPAAGYWQMERIGVRGVLEHPASRSAALRVCEALGYPPDVETLWSAMRYSELLAACFARLALVRLPEALPRRDQPATGWQQYLKAWGPGKPKPEKWERNWQRAWEIVS